MGQVGIEPTQPYDNRLRLEECMILRYFQHISNLRFDTVYSVITVCPASPTAALTHINYVKQLRDPAGVRTQDPNIKSVVLYLLSYEIFFAESIGIEPNTVLPVRSNLAGCPYHHQGLLSKNFFIISIVFNVLLQQYSQSIRNSSHPSSFNNASFRLSQSI